MLVVAGYLPPIPKNNKAPEQEAAKKTNVLSVSSLFYDVYSFLLETTYLKICLSNETASPSGGQHRKCLKIATTNFNQKILSHHGIFVSWTRSHHHLQRRVVVFQYIHLLAEMTGFFQVSRRKQTKNEKFTNLGTPEPKGLHPATSTNFTKLHLKVPPLLGGDFLRWSAGRETNSEQGPWRPWMVGTWENKNSRNAATHCPSTWSPKRYPEKPLFRPHNPYD